MKRTTQGFTLVELSVVLVIIAILVSFGLDIGTSAMQGSDRITTRSRLLTIQSALEAYAKVAGYLPCPASRNVAPTSSSFGIEQRASSHTDCVSGMTSATDGSHVIYIGAVPVRSLGLPDAYAGDAWGNKFSYVVSKSHVGSNSSYATVDGPITIMTGGGGGSTAYAITTKYETDGSNGPGADATYVVISFGPNGRGAWPMNGTAVGLSCGSGLLESPNCTDSNTSLTYYDEPYNDGSQSSTYFDDYVIWGTNLLDRVPTHDIGQDSNACATNGSPDGTHPCAPWCAYCTSRPLYTPYTICQRNIVDSSTCSALCVYAYPGNNVGCP